MSRRTFVELCLAGDADPEDIDDFVDEWHDTPDEVCSLPEFLGLAWNEYELWATRPEMFPAILASRRLGIPLEDAAGDLDAVPMAARALNQEEAANVLTWLKRTGRA